MHKGITSQLAVWVGLVLSLGGLAVFLNMSVMFLILLPHNIPFNALAAFICAILGAGSSYIFYRLIERMN